VWLQIEVTPFLFSVFKSLIVNDLNRQTKTIYKNFKKKQKKVWWFEFCCAIFASLSKEGKEII
jgi:hypothetical protein